MARKRQEIVLQIGIETQEEWEENLGKEGLTGTLWDMIKVIKEFY